MELRTTICVRVLLLLLLLLGVTQRRERIGAPKVSSRAWFALKCALIRGESRAIPQTDSRGIPSDKTWTSRMLGHVFIWNGVRCFG